jgi:hypothetical protein
MTRTAKFKVLFWDRGPIGGWHAKVEIDGKRYPVSRCVGDGHGAGMFVAFDNQAQARKAAIAEANRLIRAGQAR